MPQYNLHTLVTAQWLSSLDHKNIKHLKHVANLLNTNNKSDFANLMDDYDTYFIVVHLNIAAEVRRTNNETLYYIEKLHKSTNKPFIQIINEISTHKHFYDNDDLIRNSPLSNTSVIALANEYAWHDVFDSTNYEPDHTSVQTLIDAFYHELPIQRTKLDKYKSSQKEAD